MISVLILTKNEEQDLPSCLASVCWSDDVHVFDSFSTDKTVELARAAGAHVTQRRFDGYASQRNAGLREVAYKNPWILILDADEHIPAGAEVQLLAEVSQAPAAVSALRLRRRDYLYDTWLKHAQISPFYIRLVRQGKAHYHREINEVLLVDGEILDSKVLFNHYPFSKGITHWVTKHNQYSTMEAQRWLEEHQQNISFSLRDALFHKDFSHRRYHQKGLFYKLPGRPLIKWLYMVVGRRAFLDGYAGLTYATLQAIYEYFIVLKTDEALRSQKR
jgi:glycosyltransferase involved in cell wall biosynthesis